MTADDRFFADPNPVPALRELRSDRPHEPGALSIDRRA